MYISFENIENSGHAIKQPESCESWESVYNFGKIKKYVELLIILLTNFRKK